AAAGPEAVVPLLGRRMQPFAEAIAGHMPGEKLPEQSTDLASIIANAIVASLSRANIYVRLDGKAVVGELIVDIDKGLSSESIRRNR
ncbi:MAG: hypothetical protein RSB04_10805, partial [Gordonibacter sp.]